MKLLDTSTAASPTGLPTQKRLFRVPRGAFTGRLIALYARTTANLALTFADAPFTSWSAPANFVTESDDLPFDAVMDDDGSIHAAYTQAGTGALRAVKLAYQNGTWAAQAAVTIYDTASSSNKYPSITRDAYDRLWIAWTRDDAGTITLRAKSSIDDGASWGGGAADPGTDLSGSVSSVHARLVSRPTHLHCLYTTGGLRRVTARSTSMPLSGMPLMCCTPAPALAPTSLEQWHPTACSAFSLSPIRNCS